MRRSAIRPASTSNNARPPRDHPSSRRNGGCPCQTCRSPSRNPRKPRPSTTKSSPTLLMRIAPFHRGQELSRAGVAAELKFRRTPRKERPLRLSTLRRSGRRCCSPRPQPTHDPALLQQVIDAYPNSAAAVAGASNSPRFIATSRNGSRNSRCSFGSTPAPADQKGAVIADLAETELALKRLHRRPRLGRARPASVQRLFLDRSQPRNSPSLSQNFTISSPETSPSPTGGGRLFPPPQPDPNGRPLLGPAMDETSATASFATGTLLVPLEQSALLSRPDRLFVFRPNAGCKFSTPLPKTRPPHCSSRSLQPQRAALLGSVGDISVLAQPHLAIGVNTRTHALEWQIPFNPPPADSQPAPPPAAGNGNQIRVIRALAEEESLYKPPAAWLSMATSHRWTATSTNRAPELPAVPPIPKPIANSHFLISPARVSPPCVLSTTNWLSLPTAPSCAFDVATGKPKWVDSAGAPHGSNSPPALQISSPATMTSSSPKSIHPTAVPPHSWSSTPKPVKFRKQINLDDEHVQWRSVGDDGELFAVTDQSVVAYDLFSDQDSPLCAAATFNRISPPPPSSPSMASSSSTPTANSCASPKMAAKSAGPPPPPDPSASTSPIPLSPRHPRRRHRHLPTVQGILAYYTDPQESNDDQVAWIGSITQGQTPPSIPSRSPIPTSSSSHPVPPPVEHNTPSASSSSTARAAASIASRTSSTPPTADDPEGPAITAWQVVDNGIAMQVGNVVHFYHAKTQ